MVQHEDFYVTGKIDSNCDANLRIKFYHNIKNSKKFKDPRCRQKKTRPAQNSIQPMPSKRVSEIIGGKNKLKL